jgi:hypothetical protein
MSAMPAKRIAIEMDYGAADPLRLEIGRDRLAADCRGPDGTEAGAAGQITATALRAGAESPLAKHVVPGDRVTVALAGAGPQSLAVTDAILTELQAGGVADGDVTLLHSPPFDPLEASLSDADRSADASGPQSPIPGAVEFHPEIDAETAYLAADEEARPIHVARALVDADVVIAVGEWGFDATFGGRSLKGELWPTFARQSSRLELAKALARKGQNALPEWRTVMQDTLWQLGVCANLRLVAGHGDSLAAAEFGLASEAVDRAREAAAAWRPELSAPAMVAVCTLADPTAGFAAITRAVAAGSRATLPSGTVCVACAGSKPPGVIFSRWRQGTPLAPLIHEAVASGDPSLIADALLTRFFARRLGDRRLVLLSGLDESTVEDLEFGYAESTAVIERLASRAESVVLLHEADRMLPRLK